jgi:hypothetical protein
MQKPANGRAHSVLPETDALALFPSETPGPRLPAVPQETFQTPSVSGPARVGDRPAALSPPPEPEPFRGASSFPPESSTPGGGAQTRDDGEDLAHARAEPVSTSGIAVSPSATALDLPGPGDLADEVAHLQALIGEFTRPIEWRIPNVSGR